MIRFGSVSIPFDLGLKRMDFDLFRLGLVSVRLLFENVAVSIWSGFVSVRLRFGLSSDLVAFGSILFHFRLFRFCAGVALDRFWFISKRFWVDPGRFRFGSNRFWFGPIGFAFVYFSISARFGS